MVRNLTTFSAQFSAVFISSASPYPSELSSSQIAKLTGSTKNTVEAIRNGTFREAVLEAKSPMDTGLCTYQDLEKALNRAKNKRDREEAKAKSLEENTN